MADISYHDLKISLVHFFVKVEKYKADKHSAESLSYLVNPNAKFPIIEISFDAISEQDEVLEHLIASLKKAKHEKVNVLKIILSRDVAPSDDANTIIITEPMFFKDGLKQHFPKIMQLDVQAKGNDDEEMSDEELLASLQDHENSKNKDVRELTAKIRAGFTPVSYLMITMFVVLPIICIVLTYLFQSQGLSYLSNQRIAVLFFGGTDHNLTVLGNQWWRILTYGFNTGVSSSLIISIIEVIFIAMMIYTTSRYTEIVTGTLKTAVSFFVAYFLTGFVVSSAIPAAVFGGPYVALSILVGILGFSTVKKKSIVSVISRGKVILPIILLVLIPIFDGNYYNFIIFILAVGASGSILYLWDYNYKKLNYHLIAPITILSLSLIMPIVLIFAEFLVPAYRGEDIYTIMTYLQKGWIKDTGVATKILHTIGWGDLSFSQITSGGKTYFVLLQASFGG